MTRRILAATVVLLFAAAMLLIAWPQLFGMQHSPILAQLVSLRGAAIVLSVFGVVVLTLVAFVSAGARRFAGSLALVLLGFVLVSTAVLATRGFGNTSFETTGPNDVTVLSWNTLGDSPSPEEIAKLALDTGADIITLPETTRDTGVEVARIMGAAGSPMWSHTIAYDVISKARSTTLLISADLGTYSVADGETTSVLPSIIATPTDGSGPTIIAVHAVAPIPGQMANWRSDLNWLAAACAGPNVIMAGDFNSTFDHFDGLASGEGTTVGECMSSALATDNAAVGTWPSRIPALLGAPIDHIMHTANWRTSGMRVIETHDGYGSDHRPVVAQLSPAG